MARILTLCLLLVIAVAGFAAYRLLAAGVAAQVYRERLAEMSADYEALRGRYNQAVRRTAVTELRVADGRLTVVIRTADGDLQSLESPFDPTNEIYVDYVVLNGRLWIRRLFDAQTPPGEGMVVDPKFIDVDWETAGENHGKAAYRALSDGRWIVDVTGDGSLGLTKRSDEDPTELAPPPPVRRYEPVSETVDEALGAISPREALEALAQQLRLGA